MEDDVGERSILKDVVTFASFFKAATGASEPYPYQSRLAEASDWPELLEVATGAGKTEAVVISWLWRRHVGRAEPRRLVYALPMRGLVEQTHFRVNAFVERLTLALGDAFERPNVEKLLGGEVGEEWMEQPERAAILIGTQDLLLSRALNRGYAMSRFRWPMAFGLLNDDALWIIDEVQLQGVGVTTSAQLQTFREGLGTHGPTATIFVSATIDRSWLKCADYHINERLQRRDSAIALDDEDRAHPHLDRILRASKTAYREAAYLVPDVVAAVFRHHRPGTRTLVVVNQVARARDIAVALRKAKSAIPIRLLHSRFRPEDRTACVEAAFGSGAPAEAIVVATQVVEAGIDTSATTLISDIAPWASIVQRLGRCNRRGDDDDARFYWLDSGEEPSKAASLPYLPSDVANARLRLLALEGCSVAPSDLPANVHIPRERGATLRRVDLLDLFDTTPDLNGNDVDVSRFIRLDDAFNVFALWRSNPTDDRPGHRSELCPVPHSEMQKLIKRLFEEKRSSQAMVEAPTRVRSKRRVWVNALERSLRIGEIVRLDAAVGAYDAEHGFDLTVTTPVTPINVPLRFQPSDQTMDDDSLVPIGRAMTLIEHSDDAARFARELVETLPHVSHILRDCVVTAARWHDAGKAHDVFQATLRASLRRSGISDAGGPWAKSVRLGGRHARPHFRHEVVSALAWLAASTGDPDTDLIAYLVAAHHGKARVTLQTFPGEQIEPRCILGVQQGDVVRNAALGDGFSAPEFCVDLSLFDVGGLIQVGGTVERSWIDRVLTLRDRDDLGPFRLAYLETLVIVADWRASALRADPAVVGQPEVADARDNDVDEDVVS